MNEGLTIKFVKQTRKERDCQGCGKPIPVGSSCVTATGLDYDETFCNWSVHPVKECYMFFVDNIDMVDETDIRSVIQLETEDTIQGKCQ